jgi:hypothetical protein
MLSIVIQIICVALSSSNVKSSIGRDYKILLRLGVAGIDSPRKNK